MNYYDGLILKINGKCTRDSLNCNDLFHIEFPAEFFSDRENSLLRSKDQIKQQHLKKMHECFQINEHLFSMYYVCIGLCLIPFGNTHTVNNSSLNYLKH